MPASVIHGALRRKKLLCIHAATVVAAAFVFSAGLAFAQTPSPATEETGTGVLEDRMAGQARDPRVGRGDRPAGGMQQDAQGTATAPSLDAGAIGAQPSDAQGSNRQSAGPQTNNAQTGSQQSSGRLSISKADASLLRELAQVNLTEIQMAALATAISRDAEVRAYATQMLNEHYEAKNKLQQIADAGGAILPHGVNQQQAALLHDLARLTGTEFNRAYMLLAGMQLHDQSRSILKRISVEAEYNRLKAYAALYEPMPDKHLNLAKKVMGQPALGGAAGAAQPAIPPATAPAQVVAPPAPAGQVK